LMFLLILWCMSYIFFLCVYICCVFYSVSPLLLSLPRGSPKACHACLTRICFRFILTIPQRFGNITLTWFCFLFQLFVLLFIQAVSYIC
jgi:hypothetical protein